jgi:hypothetical protein
VRKPSQLLRATALAAAAAISACGYSSSNNNSQNNTLTAVIDGTAFTATNVVATHSGNTLSITATAANQQIVLTVPNVTSTGTFSLAAGQVSTAQVLVAPQDWTTAIAGGTGSVTITGYSSTYATGTFTFSAPGGTGGATGTKVVTGGSFTVYFGSSGGTIY